ncbi:peptidylprolyl isomerase [Dysgonomonas sp. 520]|uniref:peptidylprolyl isomerase n=1 Tax=Dysgonomonas sp. 520 TaxID=2302931 RepID=UPI0013CF8714|nr:peptidylprolyl isomerase [Dysgonomonas sp. 520]NDW08173.1 hypothetical protein [Dysgonomonas sp. 520]
MNKKHLTFIIFILTTVSILAQSKNDAILMKINGTPVTKSEFEYVYNKNNSENAIERKSLNEYVDLFVDFKLKTEEAKTMGIDTSRQFLREYNSYRDQLILPYLKDTVTEESFGKSLYDRYKENIEVGHILIKFSKQQLFPADTLEAYNEAMAVRARLIGKKAEAFEAVAKEVSADTYSLKGDRPGYMGWATTMMFVKEFEDAMYNLKSGEISMPVRTAFGYHLIKVYNRRLDPGQMKIAHIMFGFSSAEPAKEEMDSLSTLANSVYNRILKGEDYETLCKEYSVDRQSAEKGGEMGWMTIEVRLPSEFKDACVALTKVGDITKPIRTDFGFHIIKLLDKKDRMPWNEAKSNIMGQILRSDRQLDLNRLKKEKLEKQILTKSNAGMLSQLSTLADTVFPTDSLFIADLSTKTGEIVAVNNVSHSVEEFGKYIEKNSQAAASKMSTDGLSNLYNGFVYSLLQEEQKNELVKNNPEIKNLAQEYYDGILLFDVMNKEVWEKAANDTTGLENYFSANKSKYQWGAPKFKGAVIHYKDDATLKRVKDALKKNKVTHSNIGSILKETFANDSIQPIRLERGIWAKGENTFVDYEIFNKKAGEKPTPNEKFPLFYVQGKTIKAPEEYTDVKGLVVSDYQDMLEKKWLQSLREKYPVDIDKSVLSTIK